MGSDEDRGDNDRDIEQHRREGGNRETPVHVQHAAGKRHQRYEKNVGEHDPDELRGELDLPRRPDEAAGKKIDQPRRGKDAEHRQGKEQHRQQRRDTADEIARRVLAARAFVLGEYRHERLRERAFGEQPPQNVGQTECGFESVHLQAGTEADGFQAFANESRDPRQQRQCADGGQRLEQIHRQARVCVTEARMRVPWAVRIGFGVGCKTKKRRREQPAAVPACAKPGKSLLCPVFFGCSTGPSASHISSRERAKIALQ